MSIDYDGYSFSAIESLNTWNPPSFGGIYAITYKKDPTNKPNVHTPLYFGETDDFIGRRIDSNHHKYECWKNNANQGELYVSIHREDNDDKRKDKERKLIDGNSPICND